MSAIFSLLSFQWFGFSLWAGVAFAVTFYVAGSSVISRFKVPTVTLHYLLSQVLGLVMWAILGYVVGYLHLRWLSYFYIAGVLVIGWQRRTQEVTLLHQLITEIKQTPKWLIGIIVLGLVTQMLPVFGSGLRLADGIHFYRVNAYDGVLHLAFIQSLVQHFPPPQPGAVGLFITNYHFWSDLVIAEVVRVWHLPISHAFFQFFPVYISLLTGLATYQLIKIWGGTRSTATWALFFLYAGSDIAYLFMLVLHRQFGAHIAAIDNGVTQFLNVPHTFAELILTTALIPLTLWITTKEKKWAGLSLVLLATLVGFKVYYGMFAAVGFSLLLAVDSVQLLVKKYQDLKPPRLSQALTRQFLTHLLTDRALWFNVGLLLSFALISGLIFFPTNQGAGGLFYSPLEWPKLFLGRDNLYFLDWWLRQQVYAAAGNTRNLFILDVIAVAICLGSVLGTRLVGFYPHRKLLKTWGWHLAAFLIPGTFVFLWLGLFTLQTSGLFNVFNFFVVTTIPLSLASAFMMDSWWQSRHWLWRTLVIIFVMTTLPRSLYFAGFYVNTYRQNIVERVISADQQAAFEYIKTHTPPTAVIQTHPYNSMDRITPYVAFFTNHPTYITGVSMLESHNQPIQERKKWLFDVFANAHTEAELAQALKSRGISYLYLTTAPEEKLQVPITGDPLKVVFETATTKVIEVK